MQTLMDKVNRDPRLDVVGVDDRASRTLVEPETSPVLATPAIAAGVGLFAAGVAVEEAADN
ncbi:hypothetical protein [Conexibacter sp. SYSU D00693]|uniref:hypothetical protein n=1 Tax=Conexibacter sp. SYSU D00693 TaxID=2812560 RepID=UPI00196ABFB9|nr:hypothetical protein [Conexibacter sp. SYSU D00693]